MKKQWIILALIFIFLSTGVAFAEDNKFQLNNPKSYTLSKTYTIKNTGDGKATNVVASVILGSENFLSYQKDVEMESKPEPDNISRDKYGNKVARYKFDKLLPGQIIEIKLQRKVIGSDVQYNIDSFDIKHDQLEGSKFELFLKSDKKIESNNEKIIEKANELTIGLEDDYSKARAIYEFVNSYMTYDDSSRYRNKGAISALTSGRGVCEDYSTLFVALCRASGIPSRVIDGYRLENEFENIKVGEWYNADLSGHTWAEFYINGYGWIPVEATQIYTVNGVREVYWEGLAGLKGSMYVACGLYNPSEPEINLTYYIDSNSDSGVVLEPIKQKIKFEGSIQEHDVEDSITADSSEIIDVEQMSFKDIKKDDWAYNYVNNVYQIGIIKGYEDNSFRPDNKISRIEFLVMFARMLKYMEYNVGTEEVFYFSDYPNNHWSSEEYVFLSNCFEKVESSGQEPAGHTTLTRVFNDKLDINKPITREEAVALFDKFLNDYGSYENNFVDIEDSEFRTSILKAYQNKLINGYEGGRFRPENNITRREAAKLFDTYLNLFVQQAS